VTPPRTSPYVVVGAGIHGLSTAYHLAKELRTRGLGSGADIVVLDKSSPGAGASGIACGVVRNNYFQPAMSELMQACVEVWESDPAAYHYNPVGYIALGASVQQDDLIATYERQEQIGYRSELIVGAEDVDAHMKALFPDWRARGVTVCLHEHQGGFAFNMASVLGLAEKCESEGVTIYSGVEVQEFEFASDDSVKTVVTAEGSIEVGEQLVLAPGPWAKRFWEMLGFQRTYYLNGAYQYGIVKQHNCELHFHQVKKPVTAGLSNGGCLMIVSDVEQLHAVFTQKWKAGGRKMPGVGLPRITRMKPGQTRFTVTYRKTKDVKRSMEKSVVDACNRLFINRFRVITECADR